MIPLLGTLVLNRADLLERMIASVDYPVEKLAIIQNTSDPEVAAVVDKICKTQHPYVHSFYLERPFRNLGCGPGWNSIIKSFSECPWWLIANNDHVFLPGDLAKFYQTVEQNPMSFVAAQTGSFSAFAVPMEVIDIAGLFDENIWPIYCEDIDYIQRLNKANIKFISIDSDVGETRNGSWTIRSSEVYAAANSITQKSNADYVAEKWGNNYSYGTPFNRADSVSFWKYNPQRRHDHSEHWKNFEETAQKVVPSKAVSASSLSQLITQHSLVTDKNSIHSYCDHFYEQALSKYKSKDITLLEIGCDQGGSLELWARYFKSAKILGYDITWRGKLEHLSLEWPNIAVTLQNAYDYAALASTPQCDIIIDDGPHSLESQLFFIKNYSLKLKKGGMLIVEDIASDENLKHIQSHVPFHLQPFAKVYDFRSNKNRHDDLMLVIQLPE